MNFISTSRLRKMKKHFRAQEYVEAKEYADKLVPAEIPTAYDLSMMADVYVTNRDLESAKVVYQESYKRNKSSRNCKILIDASIKLREIEDAVSYLKDLIEMDDTDIDIYIFQYRIGKITNQSDDYLIKCLQKVREIDYLDIWALALAKLYFKTGQNEECLKECKNIKLWFPDTPFEERAQLLEDAVNAGESYEDIYGAPVPDEEILNDGNLANPQPDRNYSVDMAAVGGDVDEDPLPEINFEDDDIPQVDIGVEPADEDTFTDEEFASTLVNGDIDSDEDDDDDDDDGYECDEFGNIIFKKETEEPSDEEVGEQLEFSFDETAVADDDDDDDDDGYECDEFGNIIFPDKKSEEKEAATENEQLSFNFDDTYSDEIIEALKKEEVGETSGEEVDESIRRMLRENDNTGK